MCMAMTSVAWDGGVRGFGRKRYGSRGCHVGGIAVQRRPACSGARDRKPGVARRVIPCRLGPVVRGSRGLGPGLPARAASSYIHSFIRLTYEYHTNIGA